MKKVRFESPIKGIFNRMDVSECHSPRPFIERHAPAQAPDIYEYNRVTYSSDPVHRYEYSNSSPYPLAKKSIVPTACEAKLDFLPSNELNLSMLDIHEPRQLCRPYKNIENTREKVSLHNNVLSPVENNMTPPNVLKRDDSFFIRRGNLDKYHFSVSPLEKQLDRMSLDKENNPRAKKAEIVNMSKQNVGVSPENTYLQLPPLQNIEMNGDCSCHHCVTPKTVQKCTLQGQKQACRSMVPAKSTRNTMPLCHCQSQILTCFHCEQHVQKVHQTCLCTQSAPTTPQNAVDKKTWAIEKFQQSNKVESMEVEKQTNVSKEKREPTISDLVKIIKLQNEQLQLLQDKVDKFISTNSNTQQQIPAQNYMTEHVALQTIDSEHKISVGVMTSFEMVRTSTVINKEIVTQNKNAQIQCNRSQISITEVVSQQPVNLNILEGITPVHKGNPDSALELTESIQDCEAISTNPTVHHSANMNGEKTFNELSLYNVQVDNATTPLMSPEQTLYLDVKDYSDSDSTSSIESNVGWTYYNKVMTRVNGLLQDSDMPSSASALYRNTRQQCLQMQIDKTNVSVTKRVKFGDDPLGIHQPHIYSSTDTSLKMNQLAAKYLKTAPAPQPRPVIPDNPVEMSRATRNYMEKHNLLQGVPGRTSPSNQIPRFLDITALKQQPKLL